MNDQEIFDRVSAHLLTQMKKAGGDDGSCRYRGDGGLKCAVGCLIPDDLYDPKIEGLCAESLVLRRTYSEFMDDEQRVLAKRIIDALGIKAAQARLLESLQHLHDGSEPKLWKDGLRRLAEHFGLAFNAPV